MDLPSLAHLAAAACYAGFQWTVRAVVYPQLLDGGRRHPAGFPAAEAAHQRRTARLVGPLFAALGGATVVLVASRPGSPLAWACGACTAVVLGVTAAGAVPRHRRLAARFDEADAGALLRWDAVRTAAATTQAVLAAVLAAGVAAG